MQTIWLSVIELAGPRVFHCSCHMLQLPPRTWGRTWARANVICLLAKVLLTGRKLFNSISDNLIAATLSNPANPKEKTQHWQKN